MKILQLSTGHLGGAGLAARRLNNSLNRAGIESIFIALANPSFSPGENEISVKRTRFKRAWGGWLAWMQRFLSKQTLFTPFSTNSISVKYLLRLAKPSETIIHIHNFQNLVSEASIKTFSDAGYKVVLTLHDQRFFTGGCHYSFDCQQYEFGCSKCPLIKNFTSGIPRGKLQASPIEKIHSDKLQVIAPSKWMISRANQSQILGKFQKHHINNLLGSEWSSSIKQIRRKGNFGMRVGIASMDPSSFIKGGDIIQEILHSPLGINFEFLYLKDFSRNGQASDFWEQIDCLLVPSRADNSPNVIHEAKSLQIPIIASKVGGIPELLGDSDVCIPPEDMCAQTLISAFEKFHSQKTVLEDSNKRSNDITERDVDTLNQYLTVYRDLLSRKI
jgi:glycosyltransferase involved in cell wall biosynthesis